MEKSRWICDNPKDFIRGDIICDRPKQNNLKLVLRVDNEAIWVTGLVHCAFTENYEKHPIFPIYFDELYAYEPLLKLGNLKDYSNFIDNIQKELDYIIDDCHEINNKG